MRALCALCFCAFSVAAVLYLPGAGCLGATLAALGAAGLVALAVRLRRRTGIAPAAFAARTAGGRALLALLGGWNLLILGAAAGNLCDAYQTGTPWPLTGLLLLLMAAWAARSDAAERVGAIVFYFLVGLYALLLLFALPGCRVECAGMEAQKWRLLPGALSPVCAVWLLKPDAGRVRLWPWLTGGVALAFLCALVCGGIGGSFPFYTMAQSISIFGVLERLEPIVSVGLTAGGFCLLALLCRVNTELLHTLLPRTRSGSAVCLHFAAGCGGLWLSGQLPAFVLPVGTAIFWGLLPIGTLLVANFKKSEKIKKKC